MIIFIIEIFSFNPPTNFIEKSVHYFKEWVAEMVFIGALFLLQPFHQHLMILSNAVIFKSRQIIHRGLNT